MANNSKDYYFAMEEFKQRELLQKVSGLKLGDFREEVIKRLGPPTYDHKFYTKEKGEFRGRTLMYYLKIWEKDLVNEKHDRFVMLQFDTGDRLTKIIQKVEDSH